MAMEREPMDHQDVAGLEPYFQAARSEVLPGVSSDLLTRIMADADREAALRTARADHPRPAPGWPIRLGQSLRDLFDSLGGWPATAGLAATAVVGVWIGYSPPTALNGLLGSTDLSDVYSSPAAILAGYDAFLVDG